MDPRQAKMLYEALTTPDAHGEVSTPEVADRIIRLFGFWQDNNGGNQALVDSCAREGAMLLAQREGVIL